MWTHCKQRQIVIESRVGANTPNLPAKTPGKRIGSTWRALRRALESTGSDRAEAIANALAFRHERFVENHHLGPPSATRPLRELEAIQTSQDIEIIIRQRHTAAMALAHSSKSLCVSAVKAFSCSLSMSMVPITLSPFVSNIGTMISDCVVPKAVR